MALPSVTNTFINGTTADGPEVSTNFTDIINSLTDGTKSLTIDAFTTNGATALGTTLSVSGIASMSTSLRIADGTVSVPSIAFTSDIDKLTG